MGPRDVALAVDGTILVTDLQNYCVHQFSAEGAYMGVWGATAEEGRLPSPVTLAVGPGGIVCVGNNETQTVACFAASGEWLGTFALPMSDEVEYEGLQSVAMGPEGQFTWQTT
jgi:hypothetical protein